MGWLNGDNPGLGARVPQSLRSHMAWTLSDLCPASALPSAGPRARGQSRPPLWWRLRWLLRSAGGPQSRVLASELVLRPWVLSEGGQSAGQCFLSQLLCAYSTSLIRELSGGWPDRRGAFFKRASCVSVLDGWENVPPSAGSRAVCLEFVLSPVCVTRQLHLVSYIISLLSLYLNCIFKQYLCQICYNWIIYSYL